MSFDPLFARLIEVHPNLITDVARRYLLPVPHATKWVKHVRRHSFRMVPVTPKPILPTETTSGVISLDELLRQICAKHKLTKIDVISASRSRGLVNARQEFFYRAATETTHSYPKIGRFVGNRDHTTVMYGVASFCAKHGLQRPRALKLRSRELRDRRAVVSA